MRKIKLLLKIQKLIYILPTILSGYFGTFFSYSLTNPKVLNQLWEKPGSLGATLPGKILLCGQFSSFLRPNCAKILLLRTIFLFSRPKITFTRTNFTLLKYRLPATSGVFPHLHKTIYSSFGWVMLEKLSAIAFRKFVILNHIGT